MFVSSSDGISIHYTDSGKFDPTLVLVHGWLGSSLWWNSQEKYFSKTHRVLRVDLGGHGLSQKGRKEYSSRLYADDIAAVANASKSENLVLVGHSMSGAYTLEAALKIPHVKAVVLVDTLKNLDQLMTFDQAQERLFTFYRNDFKAAVENLLPKFLFSEGTPVSIRQKLQNEFLSQDSLFAVQSIEPLYKMDLRSLASEIKVPVRAINSDFSPTLLEANRKYFQNYDYRSISGTGHYSMLENPDEFNRQLEATLKELGLSNS